MYTYKYQSLYKDILSTFECIIRLKKEQDVN